MARQKSAAIVDTQEALESCCQRWQKKGVFAFDTEFIRDETYDAILCLVQVNDGREVTLIDPLPEKIDLAPFWSLVTDPEIVTVVHAGKEDFEVCLRTTGTVPRNVFDVQIASGFAGHGYPLSLARLVSQVARKRIAKGQTLTDWLMRPMTREQMRYAIDDVAYLPRIHEKLRSELEKRDRMRWAREEFVRYEDPTFYRPPAEDRVFKLKGSKSLDGLGLLVLERLIEWRDRLAQSRNRPVRAMVRDDILVEIARRRPKRQRDLQIMRGFGLAKNATAVAQVLDLIAECRQVPEAEWPAPFEMREETPMMRATVDLLSAVSRAICYEEEISNDLLGASSRLRELIDYDLGVIQETPTLLRGWRAEFIGHRLAGVLRGRCEVHLTGWPKRTRLDVISHQPD